MRKFLKKAKEQVNKVKLNGKVCLSPYLKIKYEYLYNKIIIKALKENPPNKERTTQKEAESNKLPKGFLPRFSEIVSL